MNPFRRRLIALVTFLGGIYFFVTFLLPKRVFGVEVGAYDDQVLKGVQIVGIMSIGLGIINLVTIYGRVLIRERKGRMNAFSLLAGFSVMFATLAVDLYESEKITFERQKLQALQLYTEKVAPVIDTDRSAQNILREELRKFVSGESFVVVSDSEVYTTARGSLQQSAQKILDQMGDTPGQVAPLTGAQISEGSTPDGNTETSTAGVTSQDARPISQENIAQFLTTLKAFHAPYGDALKKNASTALFARLQSLLYEGFFVPLSSAIFALLAFYIATAAYRAFRIRTLESTVMMVAALLVILGQIPHGPIYISESLPMIRLWLLENISTPAFRAIYFGSTVAGLAMAVRMWLSLEQTTEDQQ